jgi:ABC-type transport system involved in Fe-S cluster assembly fused permease/ATPase subunit
LQTVKKADDIIVFENGKVIERGKHKELVQKK